MKKPAGVRVLLAVFLALILGGCGLPPLFMDSVPRPDPASKISPLLAIQVQAKEQMAATAAEADGIDTLGVATGMRTEDFASQQVFIHFEQEPTQSQMDELTGLGINPYVDSWIPPVGVHPTGFILADMPVGQLYELAARDYVVRLNTAEQLLEPANDLAAAATNADDVWNLGYDGSGIRIAVLDSGLDVTHPDIPTPVASKDYSQYPVLGNNITNTATDHGTHVTGTALGRGTQSEGQYKGAAPGADLIFLKIGGETGSATNAAMVNAIKAAAGTYRADIINISYGGWTDHQDGTDEVAQAADYAFSKGALVFVAAGNEAMDGRHHSGTAPANGSTGFIRVNVAWAGDEDTELAFNLVWFDGTGYNPLTLEYYDADRNQLTDITTSGRSQSPRGTEAQLSSYDHWLPSGRSTWYLKVRNDSETDQLFHIYEFGSQSAEEAEVGFHSSNPSHTISSPALADGAIAVGAYVTRDSWTNYLGETYQSPGMVDMAGRMASFSSRGPRVDAGAPPKPDIAAPGAWIISCLDRDVDHDAPLIITSDYKISRGTSMASPHAAGAAALLLQAYPELKGKPAAVRDVLQATASNGGEHDNTGGYGLMDVLAAYQALIPKYDLTVSSTEGGSVTEPGEGTFTYGQGTAVNLKAVAEKGYRFVNWTGNVGTIADADAATTTINMNGDYSITANFRKTYTLTVGSTTGGSVTTPGQGIFTYDEGTVVNLVAGAEQGYRFLNWTGDVEEIANAAATTTTITMKDDYSITAAFIARYDLAVASTAGGSVTEPGEGNFTYDDGAVVNLKAVAQSNYRFLNWTGDVAGIPDVQAAITTITIKGNATITANFLARYDLTISSTVGGSVTTPGEGRFTYDEGEVVNLVADPDDGYRFVNWTGHVGNIADVQAASTTITIKANSTIRANFEKIPQYKLTISSTGGGSVTGPGEDTFTYYEGTETALTAVADQGYRFVVWTGHIDDIADVNAATTIITIKRNSTIKANFEEIPQHDIAIDSNDGGSVTGPGEGTFTFYEGTMVDLVTQADEGYRFAFWTGDIDDIADVNAASTVITVRGQSAITANFEEIPLYDLAISSADGGSVTEPGEGTFTYYDETVVNLVAEPEEGYRFANWAGDVDDIADVNAAATTITVTGNFTIRATFEEIPLYDLAISSADGGSVTGPGEGTFTYYEGTVVNVAAEPEEGYRFANWAGDVDDVADIQAATTTITIKRDSAIAANFTAQHKLTIDSTPGGSVSAPGEGTFVHDSGAVVDLVAEPDEGYRFIRWTGNVEAIADVRATTTVIVMEGDYSITATFSSGDGCFIATAAYGTPMAEEIGVLREFRDEYLLSNRPGRAFVDLYYRVSPPVAGFITDHPGLKPAVRVGLMPAVAMSTVVVNTTPAEKAAITGLLLISAAVALWVIRHRGRTAVYRQV